MKATFIFKKLFYPIILFVAIVAVVVVSKSFSSVKNYKEFEEVKEGSFMVTVSAAGELLAEHSTDIKGPMIPDNSSRRNRRRGRIHARSLKILDIVPEGTMVRKGDYIAQLDKSEFDNTLKDELEKLNNMQANRKLSVLDTAMILTNLRNEIKNQVYAVEEASIILEKCVYETPAIKRKAAIDLDKEKRSLKQKRKAYLLWEKIKLKEMNNLDFEISGQKRLVNDLEDYLEGFSIRAPSDGMVIYKRNLNGTKIMTGSTINPFNMVVATLPDLSTMISKTYISEIDIGKVKEGQKVNIRVDAFRGKTFTGTVTGIALIGEQLPNSDTKMFEVTIRLDKYDPSLRPTMTTSNEIIIKSFENAIYVPLESVQADASGYSYVFKRNNTKQVVLLGASNDKDIIVKKGLNPDDEIYLSRPENPERFKLEGDELIKESDQSAAD